MKLIMKRFVISIIIIVLLIVLIISYKPLLRKICIIPYWCENLEIWGCHYAWDDYHCHKICPEINSNGHCINKCELQKPIPENCPVHLH